MDKWLWAARFFKTRALASDACDLGRIESNSHRAKAARDVHVGDMLRIKSEAGEFLVEVLQLSEVRGPAQVAQTLYRENPGEQGTPSQTRLRAQSNAQARSHHRRPSQQTRPSGAQPTPWQDPSLLGKTPIRPSL